MTDRLSIFNGALAVHLGEPALDTLTDDVPVRYALDDVWDRGGVKTCLQMGQWNFAARSARIEYEPSITPEFGYRYAFEKPSDFVRTMGVCSDEYFDVPLRRYTDEAGYWWADLDVLYVRFVSNGNQYGGDFSLWPENFTRYVEAWFASQVTKRAAWSDKAEEVRDERNKLLKLALNTDAMEQPSRPLPRGSWSSARAPGGTRDFGSKSRLTG